MAATEVLRKGTKITCPLCKAAVAEVVRDLKRGDVIGPDAVKDYHGRWRPGDAMTCNECGFPVAVETSLGTLIHTEHGWQPFSFPTGFLLPPLYRFLKKNGLWRKEWDRFLR